jgi:RNA polymerase sigma-70 factor (ECF subfamily)
MDVLATTFAITTDEVLVTRARAGDLEALEHVYRAFEGPVYNLARRLCRNAQDAEDVLQETFLEVMRSIHRYRGDGPLAGWIRKVAASKALMRLRSGKATRYDTSLDEEFEPESTGIPSLFPGLAAVAHERLDLESALSRLPDTSRAVVWLHDVEGYTHEEIAELMGKTPSFSKSALARAHARLRDWLTAGSEDC